MNTPAPTAPDEAIRAIRTLVEAQDLREAKARLRQLQAATDDATWAMIVEIANTLRFKTHAVAVAKLRNLWRHNEQFRPLIEACVPKSTEHQYIPEPPSFRPDDGPITPPASEVRRAVDPDKLIAPEKRKRNPNTKIIDDYEKALTKDERDDPGVPRAEPIIDRHDYDIDAITEVSTTLCVSCRLERAAIDRHTEREKAGLGDDGLCGECRSLGRTGLPELSPGHTLTDQIHTRLDYLAEQFQTRDRGIFRQEWRYADRNARPIISSWVKAHTNPDPVRDTVERRPKGANLNGWCESCGEYRQLSPAHAGAGKRSGELCFDCDPYYQQPGIQAGSIESRHSRYTEEIRSTRSAPETRSSSDKAQNPNPAAPGAQQQQIQPEHNSAASKPEASAPSLEHRRKLIETARDKARAAAQERRRAMARRPTSTAPTRTIRH
ncbi:hypothetical protein NS506_02657 [Nocardia seriolae]|uniref:Uncharacterized protein n=1 Tax=Nocardia seriolae TaxID=37332 RepID=A0ABC8AR73_9NOCA|nr:hypothetical protein [Nocardia seriolae]APA96719.1 hypothetical protein NS506_02657 [Nocardia seriolae]